MSNLIFQPYFEELDQKAASFFATEHKEDFLKDLVFNEMNLINEAFDDLNALMAYRNTINTYGTLSNEQFGFIASHVNLLETKYKGLISIETLVSESHNSVKKATIVSEAISTRTGLLIAGIIAAIVGMIAWILGKGKKESKTASEQSMSTIIDTNKILYDAMNNIKKKKTEETPEQAAERETKRRAEFQSKVDNYNRQIEEAKTERERKKAEEDKKIAIAEAERRANAIAEYEEEKKNLGEKAPSFGVFTSSSRFLQQFVSAGNIDSVSYKEVEKGLDNLYEYHCELTNLIEAILEPTKRYAENMLEMLKMADDASLVEGDKYSEKIVDYFTDGGKIDNDTGKVISEKLQAEINHYLDVGQILNRFIVDEYSTVLGHDLDAEVSYYAVMSHSVSFSLKGNNHKTPEKKKFTMFEGITPYECHELNLKCEHYTKESHVIFNIAKSSYAKFEKNITNIEKICKRVSTSIDGYNATKKLFKLEGAQAGELVSIISSVLKNIRSNIALAVRLKTLSETQFNDSCEFVNSLAKTAVKKVN